MYDSLEKYQSTAKISTTAFGFCVYSCSAIRIIEAAQIMWKGFIHKLHCWGFFLKSSSSGNKQN